MNWPQITVIALMAMGAGVTAAKNGEPRGPHSFLVSLISNAILAGLLYAGGFFTTN